MVFFIIIFYLTALHCAANNDNLYVVKELVKHKDINLNIRDYSIL